MFSILIYTHSDYFDILPIQLEYFEKLEANVYLLSNEAYSCPYKTILYDSAKPYASRLITGIEQINDDYIIVTHENDILIRFNEDFIKDIIRVMQDEIDSVEVKHDPRGSGAIPVNAETSILKKTEYFYNVQPTIWKRERLLQMLRTFPERVYRTIEHDDVQKYMAENYRTYTLSCKNPIQSIWHKLPPEYCYLHLTSRLMLLPCKKENNLHAAAQEEHEYIFTKYLATSKRKIQNSLYAYDNSLVETTKE